MALDEPKDTDEVFDIEGLRYVVDKALFQRAQPITVNFSAMGFTVAGNLYGGGCGC